MSAWSPSSSEGGSFRYRRSSSGLVYSVAELSRELRRVIQDHFDWVTVEGEVGNLSLPRSGHVYFSLLDESGARDRAAQLPAVLWRSTASRLRALPANGDRVIASGRIALYEPRGTYQLVVERLVPAGRGGLQAAFEALAARLAAEGLFRPERKRALPFLPRAIGVVTSPKGAAIRDFLHILLRRAPRSVVRIVPVRVQGEGAAAEVAAGIARLGAPDAGVDVIVVTRGGGSLEDLWAFNEEAVARAIFASPVPVVSAVGHETDTTIADLVADLRAPTPTAAAECVVPSVDDLAERLWGDRRRLDLALERRIERARERLGRVARSRALRDPQALLQERFERLDRARRSLENSLYNRLGRWKDALGRLEARAEGLSPLGVLARGYAAALRPDGRLARDASELAIGDRLRLRLAAGEAIVVVERVLERTEEAAPRKPPE